MKFFETEKRNDQGIPAQSQTRGLIAILRPKKITSNTNMHLAQFSAQFFYVLHFSS